MADEGVSDDGSEMGEVGRDHTSRDMYSCGTLFGKIPTTSETGATFKEVPITTTRSTRSLSWSIRRLWKVAGRSSPKNVMSGYVGH